jgi:hypothetical protein
MKTIEIEWITDRRPTEGDSDQEDLVMIPSSYSQNWDLEHFYEIKDGDPWHPVVTVTPYEEPKESGFDTRTEWAQVIGLLNHHGPTKILKHLNLPEDE